MSAGTFTLYGKNKQYFQESGIIAASVKIALITSSYTPDASATGDQLFSTPSANEIAAANGYSAGGIALSSLATAANVANTGFKVSSANPVWTAAGGSIPAWRYAVMYINGSLWGLTNPLIGYFLGDSTPADIPATTNGNSLTLACPGTGWFDLT